MRPPKEAVLIQVELTDEQAWQLAQFCKRSCFRDYRDSATSDDEAYTMIHAMNKVRAALGKEGYAPR